MSLPIQAVQALILNKICPYTINSWKEILRNLPKEFPPELCIYFDFFLREHPHGERFHSLSKRNFLFEKHSRINFIPAGVLLPAIYPSRLNGTGQRYW